MVELNSLFLVTENVFFEVAWFGTLHVEKCFYDDYCTNKRPAEFSEVKTSHLK